MWQRERDDACARLEINMGASRNADITKTMVEVPSPLRPSLGYVEGFNLSFRATASHNDVTEK
jgi:hypothetical protein